MFLKNKVIIIVFAISLLAHVIVIYVMARSTKLPAMEELATTEQAVIQARLIFDLPPIVTPDEVQTPEPEPEKTQNAVVEQAPQPIENEVIDEPSKDVVTADESQSQTPDAQPLPEEDKRPAAQTTESESFFQEKTNTSKTEPQNPLTNMARRHLSSFQQQQRNKVAQEASRNYQQQKNSPIIDNEIKDKFLTEDQKFADKRTIKADCSSTSAKTAAVILSIMGGQVDCSKPPPINSFIQNRLNKESHLPSLNQEQQKRPKSVVIEKQ